MLFDGDTAFQLLDTATGESRELISFAPREIQDFYSVSPDGKWIYVTLLELESDIWLLETGE